MESQSLVLGTVNLGNYVYQQEELTGSKKQEIDDLIKQLEGNALNVEQFPLKLLKLQRAQYPILDPEFLTMHNTIKYKGQEIQVPKFSVYGKSQEGFNDFSIRRGVRSHNIFERYRIQMSITHNRLPQLFDLPISKSMGFNFDSRLNAFFYATTTKEIWKNYRKMGDIELTSQFCGILPQEAKEKIREAETIFERDLYLIAETKPEAWTVKKLVKDPLLVGVLENKCYLIDYLKTTSIEDYVRKEFTE